MTKVNYNTIPQNGLVLDMPLDGDAKARVGTDGTATNVTWLDSEKGYVSEVGSFDGSSSIIINDEIDLDQDFSINLWFNTNILDGNPQFIWTGQETRDIVLIQDGANSIIKFQLYDGITRLVSIPYASLSTGTNYMITITRSKTTGMEIFLNTVSQDTDTFIGNANTTATTSYIGRHSTGLYYDGTIGLFKQYNKVITQQEITNLYLEGQRRLGDRASYPALLNEMKGYWDFKGGELSNLVDGVLLTATGSPTTTTDHLGRSNNAYDLDGTTQYFTAPSGTSPIGNSPRTYSIGFTKGTKNTVQSLCVTGEATTGNLFGIHTEVIQNNDIYVEFTGVAYKTGADAITNGTRYLLTVVYDGGITSTSTVHIYIDGVTQSITQDGIALTPNTSATITEIGNTTVATAREFDGIIDQVMIQDRALSADEVKALYTLTSKEYIYPFSKGSTLNLQDGLVMSLDGDGNDVSGNGNGGTLVNSPTKIRVNQSEGLTYNGTTQYTNIDVLLGDLSTSTSGTWRCIFKKNTLLRSEQFISFGDTSTTSRIFFDTGSDGKLRAYCQIAGVIQWNLTVDDTVSAGELLDIKLVQDGIEPVIYIDGVKPAQTFLTSTDKTKWFNDIPGLDNGRIGCLNWNNDGNTNFFDGQIFSPKVWNRALTAKEVEQEYYLNYLPSIIADDPGFTPGFESKQLIAESASNPITDTFTTTTDSHILVLCITSDGTVRSGGAPTFDGVTMTQAGTAQYSGNEGYAEMWYILSPSIGTGLTVSVPNDGTQPTQIAISTYTSSTGDFALDVTNQTNGSTANPTVSLTPTTSTGFIVDSLFTGYRNTTTANNRTLLYTNDTGNEGNACQYYYNAPASSTAMSYTTPADDWAIVASAFKED